LSRACGVHTNAKVESANGVISDTLWAFAHASKDYWERQPPLAVFAINNAASTLCNGLTPFKGPSSSTGARIRTCHSPISAPQSGGDSFGDSPAHYVRMRALELTVRELLAAAQQELKAELDVVQVDTLLKVGGRVLLRTRQLLDAENIGKLRPR
jgi:hypothetical protein